LTRGVLNDAVLDANVVTVPKVKMSPDLKLATVYIMPLGGKEIEPVLSALETHKKFLRGEVARKLDLKFAPDVRFRMDDSFENSAKIDALLNSPRVKRDLQNQDDAEDGPDSPTDENEADAGNGDLDAR
jgi:ribosome-binding factor A